LVECALLDVVVRPLMHVVAFMNTTGSGGLFADRFVRVIGVIQADGDELGMPYRATGNAGSAHKGQRLGRILRSFVSPLEEIVSWSMWR